MNIFTKQKWVTDVENKHGSVQFISAAESCLTLCNPMDCCSRPGFPDQHQFPELAQTHVHWVSDAIQPSHPLSSTSSPAFNLSHHSGSLPVSQFFASGGQSIGASTSASVLPMNIQDWFPLGLTGLISLQSRGLKSCKISLGSVSFWKGCVNLFYSQVGRVWLSFYELNKGTLVYSQAEEQGPLEQAIMYDCNNKSKWKKQFQHGVSIGFFATFYLYHPGEIIFK